MKRVALLAAFVVSLAELSAVGCNAILGNDPGTLLQEASTGSSCPAGEKACGTCVDSKLASVGCGGACSACPSPQNGQADCVLQSDQEVCGLGPCNPQFDNCDNDPTNGCETHTTTKENCGECGKTCAPLPFCEPDTDGGTGYVCSKSCDAPNLTCPSDSGPECINPLNDNGNCGGCGKSCTVANGTGTCVGGNCSVHCDNGDFPCGTNGACIPSSSASCGQSCTNCVNQGKVCDLLSTSASFNTCVSPGGGSDAGCPSQVFCSGTCCGLSDEICCGSTASTCTVEDSQHCGGNCSDCTTLVGPTSTCVNHQCTSTSCDPPFQCKTSTGACGCSAGDCVEPIADPNCGACGVNCMALSMCCCPLSGGGGDAGTPHGCVAKTGGSPDGGGGSCNCVFGG